MQRWRAPPGSLAAPRGRKEAFSISSRSLFFSTPCTSSSPNAPWRYPGKVSFCRCLARTPPALDIRDLLELRVIHETLFAPAACVAIHLRYIRSRRKWLALGVGARHSRGDRERAGLQSSRCGSRAIPATSRSLGFATAQHSRGRPPCAIFFLASRRARARIAFLGGQRIREAPRRVSGAAQGHWLPVRHVARREPS